MKYRIAVDDNFHFMDESERDFAGEYENADDAINAAKEIVDKSLKWLYKEGMTADKLFGVYMDYGDDPFIISEDKDCKFSAWTYAEKRCEDLCK